MAAIHDLLLGCLLLCIINWCLNNLFSHCSDYIEMGCTNCSRILELGLGPWYLLRGSHVAIFQQLIFTAAELLHRLGIWEKRKYKVCLRLFCEGYTYIHGYALWLLTAREITGDNIVLCRSRQLMVLR